MKYRKFGRMEWEVSALGLGLAALPADEAASVKIISYAIANGVNFIDLGWPFAHHRGEFLGRVLAQSLTGSDRKQVKISATIPAVKIKTPADFDRYLEDILSQFATTGLDFLTLGGLNRFTWPQLQEASILERAEAAIASDKVRHLGFFFRDQFHFLRDIMEAWDNWAFAQFHYSFMDGDRLPGVSGLQLAAAEGLGVIASKPLIGGRLVNNIPASVAVIWAGAGPQGSPAEWALRWAWNHSEISTVVSDVANIGQLKQNLALADESLADSFTVPEELVISRVRDAYRALKPLPCTTCRGCMPCPQGIDAPRIFEIYNDAVMYGDADTGRQIYRQEKHDARLCNECGICADACGFKFPIPEWLKKAQELLA